jgi:hypothetical protein
VPSWRSNKDWADVPMAPPLQQAIQLPDDRRCAAALRRIGRVVTKLGHMHRLEPRAIEPGPGRLPLGARQGRPGDRDSRVMTGRARIYLTDWGMLDLAAAAAVRIFRPSAGGGGNNLIHQPAPGLLTA